MQRWCFTLAAVSALSVATPVPAHAQKWFDGLYVGANIGSGWGNIDREISTLNSWNADGSLLGLHAGFSWQSAGPVFFGSGLVVGVEADGALTAIRGDDHNVGGTIDMTQFESLWSLRLRLGVVPMPNLLLFGTLGWAGADIEHTNFGAIGGGLGSQPFRDTVTGWTWGLGAQWAFNNVWSIRAEYRKYDFDSTAFPAPLGALNPFQVNTDLETFTVGFSMCLTGC